ncbi:MAG: glycosyltransferase family 1 protein [Crocinitomicaceae bacterium]|nr:MAG: glycosyltransferase family 1 protein [Crocinitomicaceae bacterium]
MIKVLRIINRFNIGGPTYNATFLTRFIGDDFETLLLGGLPEEGEADSLHIPHEYGVEPTILDEMKRTPNFKSDREAYRKIKEIISEFKPDIVHTHASKAGALGRRAAFACDVPVVVHTFHGHVFHSYFSPLKTNLYKVIERRLAKKSTGIIAISDLQKKELSEKHKICKASKIKVIPLGFDLEKFRVDLADKRIETRKKYQLSEKTIAVAIVGRLAPIKNHAFFLQVVENLLAKGIQQAQFFIVGDGELRSEIESKSAAINQLYGEKIVLTSWIKDIASFNAGMDVICLTSDNEGTPVSLIEAQACNVPIVSTEVGGVLDIVSQGETGFVVPKGDLHAFAEKLGLLIENEEIRKKMSQNGWNFVKDKFHYTRLAADMANYYRELLKKR